MVISCEDFMMNSEFPILRTEVNCNAVSVKVVFQRGGVK